MKQSTKRLIAIMLVIIMIPLAVTPAHAFIDSPNHLREGVDAKGIMARDFGEVYIAEENHTFDIPNFPSTGDTNEKYKGRLITEYTLVNPTDKDASFKLATVINEKIDYSTLSKYNYKFYVNGEKATPVERVTLKRLYDDVFEEARDFAQLTDDYIYDDFFNSDATVTKYTINVEGVTKSDNGKLQMTMHFPAEDKNVRYLFLSKGYTIPSINDTVTEFDLTLHRISEGSFEAYLVGEPYGEIPKLTLYTKDGKVAEGSVTMVESGTLSFSEFIDENVFYNDGVSDIDLYNMVVSDCQAARENNHFVGNLTSLSDSYLNYSWRWYEIEVSIKAGESIQLRLEQPLYPDVDTEYNPHTYNFGTLISSMPHANGASVDVKVNTDFYLLDCSADFNEIEGGYAFGFKNLSELQDGRFNFTLCESQNPKKGKNGLLHTIETIIFFIVIIFLNFFTKIYSAIKNLFK